MARRKNGNCSRELFHMMEAMVQKKKRRKSTGSPSVYIQSVWFHYFDLDNSANQPFKSMFVVRSLYTSIFPSNTAHMDA